MTDTDRKTKKNYIVVPAIAFLGKPERAKDEPFNEYRERRWLMNKAKKSMECYGTTEAGLKFLASLDAVDGSVNDLLEFVGIARRG